MGNANAIEGLGAVRMEWIRRRERDMDGPSGRMDWMHDTGRFVF